MAKNNVPVFTGTSVRFFAVSDLKGMGMSDCEIEELQQEAPTAQYEIGFLTWKNNAKIER